MLRLISIWREYKFLVQLLLPAFLAIAIFQFFPVVEGIVNSFLDLNIYNLKSAKYVGLGNFSKILKDDIFLQTVIPNTLLLMASAAITELCLGLVIAKFISREYFGKTFVLTTLLLPLMISPSISGLMFRWLFNNEFGPITLLLNKMGFPSVPWLAQKWTCMFVVFLSDVWIYTPLFILIFYAALGTLPREPHEAARLEGCSEWQVFWHISLPMLAPVMLVMIVLRCFDLYRIFDAVWIITGGGPGGSTEVFGTYAYKEAFVYFHFGKGSAVCTLGATIIIVIGLLMYKMFAKVTRYQRGTAYYESVSALQGVTQKGFRKYLIYATICLTCFIFMLPILYLILTSIRPASDVYYVLQAGWAFSLENFKGALGWENIISAFINSIIVATVSSIGSLAITLPSGYLLARYRNRFSDSWFFLIYVGRAIPLISLILPLFLLVHTLGLFDTYWGILFAHTAFHVTFYSWVSKGFFEAIPFEIEEAAYIEGCSRWGAFLRIVIPQSKAAIIALGILGWLWSWNELLFAMILTSGNVPMLTPTIAQFVNEMGLEWGMMSATGVMALLPAIIMTVIGQKYIVRGLGRL